MERNGGDMNWQTDAFNYGVEVLLAEKPKEKCILKALEELNELCVKLLHHVNKPTSLNEGDIEEEIADIEMHLVVLKIFFPVSDEIRQEKILKFLESDDFKKYKKQYETRRSSKI